MQSLRIGLIGLTGRGGLGYYVHRPGEGSEVVAGADADETALSFFRDTYNGATFTSRRYHDLLAQDLDAVIISSPASQREEQAIAALAAGKAVFLDKPMALNVDACDRILDAARSFGHKLYVGNALRHTATVQKIIQLADAGAVGEVKAAWCRHFVADGGRNYFRDWHAEKACVNSLLVQEGVDALAVLQRICNSSARAVSAMGALAVLRHDSDALEGPAPVPGGMGHWPLITQRGLNEVVDVEDISMVSMTLHNGALTSYQQCHFTPDNWHNFTVIGTRGRMENFGEDSDGAVIRVWNRPMPYYNPWGDEQHAIPRDETIRSEDGRMMSDFLTFLRSDTVSLENAVEARNAVAAADLATRSMRGGGVSCELAVSAWG